MAKRPSWSHLRAQWAVLSYYQRFEGTRCARSDARHRADNSCSALPIDLWRSNRPAVGALDPLDHGIFQSVFGEILTLLIALEFNHSLQYVVKREQSIIQTKIVLLIALLAIARKFIVLDLGSVDAAQLLGLAAITLALGITYWLLRERDDRTDVGSSKQAE